VVVRPDVAASGVRNGQVVHGAGPSENLSIQWGCRTPARADFPWPGLDYQLAPSVLDALAVRADRANRFSDYLTSVTPTDFSRPVEVLENGTNPLQECLYTVLEEEFWHNRYARRDLEQLEAAT